MPRNRPNILPEELDRILYYEEMIQAEQEIEVIAEPANPEPQPDLNAQLQSNVWGGAAYRNFAGLYAQPAQMQNQPGQALRELLQPQPARQQVDNAGWATRTRDTRSFEPDIWAEIQNLTLRNLELAKEVAELKVLIDAWNNSIQALQDKLIEKGVL